MTQTAEPALPDPKIRKAIWTLKQIVKNDARFIRELKRCRKTKNPAPDELMQKHGCTSPAWATLRCWQRRREATAALIVYGELRGKPHPVRKPERWAYLVKRIKEDLGI